jgi:hypothetical protein
VGHYEIIWEDHLLLPIYQMNQIKLLDFFLPFIKAHYFLLPSTFWSVKQLVSSALDATGYLFKPWGVPYSSFYQIR